MDFVLKSLDEAIAFAQGVQDGSVVWDPQSEPVHLDGELAALTIEMEGERFAGQISGEIARALAAYQDSIYSLGKTVVHGSDDRPYVRLSNEQRQSFELEITVDKGCTKIKLFLQPISEAVGDGIRKMSSTTLAWTLVAVVAIATTGVCVHQLGGQSLSNQAAAQTQAHVQSVLETVTNSQLSLVQELVRELPKIANKHDGPEVAQYAQGIVGAMASAQSVGMRELAKAAPMADSIAFGASELDTDDIKKLNSRAPRSVSEPFEITESVNVYGETRPGLPLKVTFRAHSLPGEIDIEVDQSEFSDDQVDALWSAIRGKTKIAVTLSGFIVRDKIKGAVLVDIHVD